MTTNCSITKLQIYIKNYKITLLVDTIEKQLNTGGLLYEYCSQLFDSRNTTCIACFNVQTLSHHDSLK